MQGKNSPHQLPIRSFNILLNKIRADKIVAGCQLLDNHNHANHNHQDHQIKAIMG